ncbi:MAG: FAD-dependent oxidoreductase [Solirubrobacteraceae bacterium]|nr:FAD-dependent oxidoreductase [Solirubrobacteraceae bacterium]
MSTPLTRRDALKGVVGLAALGAGVSLSAPKPASAAGRDRVAIIGAGAGGVAAAYFLAGTFDVDVFEARSRIGGHCDSRTIDYQGQPVTVDLGAQFFHPDTHPLYVTLLDDVGLAGEAHAAPGSLSVFPVAGGRLRFSSTNPFVTLPNAIGFAAFTQLARRAVRGGMSWDTTVDQWIRRQPLDPSFKSQVLYPWITATIGCSRAEAAQASARSILQTFALAFPANPLNGASTYNSKIGLQGNLQRLLDRAPTARVHLDAPTQGLAREGDDWFLQTPAGRQGPYRYVVLNAPPRVGRELLRPLPAFGDVTAQLDKYEYFDSRLLIHRDPVYAHPKRRYWAAYNAGVDGLECEGSAWVGALHDRLPSGAPIDVFKSWAQRRRDEPQQVLLERRFQHPLINARALSAARALRPLQGRSGLYFSGTYTTGTDLQETAVYSAMKVAEAIAPSSPTLASLQARMTAKGIRNISYDL